jgi:hypothetical protein
MPHIKRRRLVLVLLLIELTTIFTKTYAQELNKMPPPRLIRIGALGGVRTPPPAARQR